MRVRTAALLLLLGCLAVLVVAQGAAAQAAVPQLLVTLNEYGFGTATDGQGSYKVPSHMGPDIGPGGLPLALTYVAPPGAGLVVGDVILTESPTGGLSDIIRFNPDGTVIFYSDNSETSPGPNLVVGPPELADVGFPGSLYANQASVPEQGDEVFSWADYTPLPNQPGFSPGAAITYHFVSDVPEPATLSLLGLGALGALARRRARKA